jgi:hypothetical protein
MTKEQKNLRLAHLLDLPRRELAGSEWWYRLPDGTLARVPDYCNDLNALWPILEKADTNTYLRWCCALESMVGAREALNASAEQRVDALLAALEPKPWKRKKP